MWVKMSDTKSLKGYMTSLEINGSRYPHRLQNILIREYCRRQSAAYLFSLTEVSVMGAYFVLSDLIRIKSQYDGVVFFSLTMLPSKAEQRRAVYQLIEDGKEIHFCLEQLVISSVDDIETVEQILSVRHTLSKVPFGGRYSYTALKDTDFMLFLDIQADTY